MPKALVAVEHVRRKALFQLRDASQHRGMVDAETLGGRSNRAATGHGEEVAYVVPIDHPIIASIPYAMSKPGSVGAARQYFQPVHSRTTDLRIFVLVA
jgi:hypothetical protein